MVPAAGKEPHGSFPVISLASAAAFAALAATALHALALHAFAAGTGFLLDIGSVHNILLDDGGMPWSEG
jgi:hypothetical protein